MRETTNNRMEMLAVIKALEALKRPSVVVVTTDSQYLMRGITQWIKNWKKRGWKTAENKPVKNQELWTRLDELTSQHTVTWRWVKGHNNHSENERVDQAARRALKKYL